MRDLRQSSLFIRYRRGFLAKYLLKRLCTPFRRGTLAQRMPQRSIDSFWASGNGESMNHSTTLCHFQTHSEPRHSFTSQRSLHDRRIHGRMQGSWRHRNSPASSKASRRRWSRAILSSVVRSRLRLLFRRWRSRGTENV